MGLAFKPNTGDVREALSIKVVDRLLLEGAVVCAYDPAAMRNTRKIFREEIFSQGLPGNASRAQTAA